ncbi:MAG: serine hydrolase domain-containing protein [Verrucomicrobiota bacterium]
MHTHQIPGVALTVIKHGREVKTAAYGLANLELNVPVRSDTVFEIGSVTKQFTAAAILLLQQQGKLSVNDPLSKHLPAAPGRGRTSRFGTCSRTPRGSRTIPACMASSFQNISRRGSSSRRSPR